MRDLAGAVAIFHRASIIHRDLNPSNVLLAEDGAAKVSDYGLVRFLDESAVRSRMVTLAGTPGYIAPEVALGGSGSIGPASDVFSLGAILYELLTGQPPYLGATSLETLRLTIEDDPPSPSRLVPGLP